MNHISLRRNLMLLLGPGSVFLLLVFLAPLLFVLVESLQAPDRVVTLARYRDVLVDEQFRAVYFRTLKVALIVTPIAVLLAYPSAYYVSRW